MSAAQLTIPKSTAISQTTVAPLGSDSVTGRIGSLVARVFGCRHAEMSRPFCAYRSCLNCGAQRHFNLSNWQMQGSFYYGHPQRHQIRAV